MSNQITAHNLSSNQELSFVGEEPFVIPEWAVAYGYAQDTNRLSELLTLLHEGKANRPECLGERFPLRYDHSSVRCGDWAALLPKSQVHKDKLAGLCARSAELLKNWEASV